MASLVSFAADGPQINISSGGFFISLRLHKVWESDYGVHWQLYADAWVHAPLHNVFVWLESKPLAEGDADGSKWRAGDIPIDPDKLRDELHRYLDDLISRRREILAELSRRLWWHWDMAHQLQCAIDALRPLASVREEVDRQ